jgi:hypothetical protein
MAIDVMLCAELQRIVNCPGSHIERYAEFILSKMDEAGCTEFMVSPVDETLQIVPLRMGYEADEIDWLYTSNEVYVLQIMRERSNVTITCRALSRFQRKEHIERLPKLPDTSRGAKAIENAVTRVLTHRVLEAHEPPFPKDNPAYWPNWARYCNQCCHPTLGAWLEMAIARHKSINAA